MAELEEEEAGCFRDQMAKKRGAHVSPISHVHDHLAELFIIRRESLVFFGEMSHVLL
jgi:hypothetical protein